MCQSKVCFELAQVERGLACAPGSVPTFSAAVAVVEKIRFFAGAAWPLNYQCKAVPIILPLQGRAQESMPGRHLLQQSTSNSRLLTGDCHVAHLFVRAGEVRSKAKMHVSVGHATVMAQLEFFGLPDAESVQPPQPDAVAAGLKRLSHLTQQVSSVVVECYARHEKGEVAAKQCNAG